MAGRDGPLEPSAFFSNPVVVIVYVVCNMRMRGSEWLQRIKKIYFRISGKGGNSGVDYGDEELDYAMAKGSVILIFYSWRISFIISL